MSYEKQNWKNGDVITETKLNHMEDGIAGGGGVLVVNATLDGDTVTLDKTWQQIYDAPYAVVVSLMGSSKGYAHIDLIQNIDNNYSVITTMGGNPTTFSADSADGYPVNTGD